MVIHDVSQKVWTNKNVVVTELTLKAPNGVYDTSAVYGDKNVSFGKKRSVGLYGIKA